MKSFYRTSSLLAMAMAFAVPLFAQVYDEDEGRSAYWDIRFDRNGTASTNFTIYANGQAKGWAPGQAEDATAAARKMRYAGLMERALGGPLTDVQTVSASSHFWMSAKAPSALRRDGAALSGSIPLTAVWEAVRHEGANGLGIHLAHPRLGFGSCSQGKVLPQQFGGDLSYFMSFDSTAPPPPHLAVSFGFRPWHLAVIIVAMLSILVSGVIILILARSKALAAAAGDGAGAWFGYWRWFRWANDGCWLAWFAALSALKLDRWLEFTAGPSGTWLYPLALIAPPAVLGFAGQLMARPLWQKTRNVSWSAREVLWQELTRQAASLWPLMLLLTGLGRMAAGPGQWALWAGLAAAVFIVGARLHGKATRMTPHQLLSGDLLERAMVLARQAGARLERVYIMPAKRMLVGNAFALSGSNLMLTDYLLERLGKREADAIIGHEIGHLKKKHPLYLSLFGLVLLFYVLQGAFSAAASIAASLLGIAARGRGGGLVASMGWFQEYLLLPLGLAVALLLFYALSRRFERSADEFATLLTGDPEALVTALVKLSRMNLIPLAWGRWDERLGTHPATIRRIQAVARRYSIPDDRLQRLLALDADSAREPGYKVPDAITDTTRVFTSAFRTTRSLQIFFTSVLALTLLPLGLASLLTDWLPAWKPLGLIIVPLLYLGFVNYASLWGYRRMRGLLRRRLEGLGTTIPDTGCEFVGLAPEPGPRVYEGHTVWDVGFLWIDGERLVFAGDQAWLALPRGAVHSIELVPGFPSLFRVPDIAFTVHAPQGMMTLRFHSVDGPTMLGIGSRTRNLFLKVRGWYQPAAGAAHGGDTVISQSPEPSLATVRGQAPKAALQGGAVALSWILVAALNIGLGSLLGIGPAARLWAVALALWTLSLPYLPIMFYREREPKPDTKGLTG